MRKRELAGSISNLRIDELYASALENGALGGKLLGAGGGGFLLFYVKEKDKQRLRRAIRLLEMPFGFDTQGSAVIYVGQKTKLCI